MHPGVWYEIINSHPLCHRCPKEHFDRIHPCESKPSVWMIECMLFLSWPLMCTPTGTVIGALAFSCVLYTVCSTHACREPECPLTCTCALYHVHSMHWLFLTLPITFSLHVVYFNWAPPVSCQHLITQIQIWRNTVWWHDPDVCLLSQQVALSPNTCSATEVQFFMC